MANVVNDSADKLFWTILNNARLFNYLTNQILYFRNKQIYESYIIKISNLLSLYKLYV